MSNADKNILITPNRGSTTADPKIDFVGADASTAGQTITLNVLPTSNGTLSFEGSAGQLFSITNDLTGTIFSVNDVSGIPSIEVDADGTVKFAEFSGRILIGTATDNGNDKIQVVGNIRTTGSILAGTVPSNPGQVAGLPLPPIFASSVQDNVLVLHRNTTNGGVGIEFYNGTSPYIAIGTILCTGGSIFSFDNPILSSGEITAFSDARLKDNIEVIADSLTKILKLRGVTFTRTDQKDKETRYMGVIAQEIEEYFPEVVYTTEDSIKSVNYGGMAGAFIEAFKAQQTQIDELKELVKKLLDK
jgi:hypothetical protein